MFLFRVAFALSWGSRWAQVGDLADKGQPCELYSKLLKRGLCRGLL